MTRHIPFLFLSEDELKHNKLSEENFNHLIKVLRLKKADFFTGLDNLGNKFDCTLDEISNKSVSYQIKKQVKYEKPGFILILVQALTKLDAFEEIIDKAVQLGINRILPIITKNTTVSTDVFEKKIPRFNKIIKTAAEQSQRIFLPDLGQPVFLQQYIETADLKSTVIAFEKSTLPIKKALRDYSENSITLVCGPEGGFAEEEIKLLNEKGFILVSLGKNILRAETAVISGLSNILYELGDKF